MTGLALTHLGGPTVLAEVGGWRVLTDPTFDPPGRRYRFGWGTASTKTAGPEVPVDELGPIDAVLLTHDHHADNLDERGRDLLGAIPVVVTTASGARRLGRLGRRGGDTRGLAAWESTTLHTPGRLPLEVTATPCRHGPPFTHPIVGDVIGFSVTGAALPEGALWFSGDTVLYDGVRQVADHVGVDVAVLHLGGVRFPITGPLRYTMTARDGLELCRLLRPRLAIPVHYEGWSHFRDGRDAIERAQALVGDRSGDGSTVFTVLPIGGRTPLSDRVKGAMPDGG